MPFAATSISHGVQRRQRKRTRPLGQKQETQTDENSGKSLLTNEIRVDELPVGRKILVRTRIEAQLPRGIAQTLQRARIPIDPREFEPQEHLYAIERRDDGLYFHGYNFGTETAALHEPGTPWECRGVGCYPIPYQGGREEKNVIRVGMGVSVYLDDIYAGKGKHHIQLGKVIEVDSSS